MEWSLLISESGSYKASLVLSLKCSGDNEPLSLPGSEWGETCSCVTGGAVSCVGQRGKVRHNCSGSLFKSRYMETVRYKYFKRPGVKTDRSSKGGERHKKHFL